MFETMKTQYKVWRKYSRTLAELESLSNRELSDLGFGRSDLTRIAREAARS
jgi:uncharacterized protein YjiS (DUF1127 family)